MRFSLRKMSADGRTRLCTCFEARRLGEHVHAGRAVPGFRTSSIKTILFENGLHCTLVKSAYLWGEERAP